MRNPKTLNHIEAIAPPGFVVYESAWLPKMYRPKWLGQYAFDARLKHARRILTNQGCKKIILYIWRPEFACALDFIPADLSCYHIDDEYSFSEIETDVDPIERALIGKVDQVFIHSPGLMERKGNINPHTMFIPNGVDFSAYASPAPEPEDLAIISRPRIGYTGFIKKQLDWPLIEKLVNRHRDWSFVFVGPRSPHYEIVPAIQEICSLPNVYFLGCKSPQDLASYPQHFDACIMPYRVDAYTNNIYPMKLHEYLASGKPVVSSPIRSLRDFTNYIDLAEGPNAWSDAIVRALNPTAISIEAVTARRNIARDFDWDKLIDVLAQTLRDRLTLKIA
jgi:glycosyltransferase involved in cell wall biosynthesis